MLEHDWHAHVSLVPPAAGEDGSAESGARVAVVGAACNALDSATARKVVVHSSLASLHRHIEPAQPPAGVETCSGQPMEAGLYVTLHSLSKEELNGRCGELLAWGAAASGSAGAGGLVAVRGLARACSVLDIAAGYQHSLAIVNASGGCGG